MASAPFKEFSHNGETIYHQKTPNGMRFAFLVVSEFFDAEDQKPGVAEVLDFIVDKLNEKEG